MKTEKECEQLLNFMAEACHYAQEHCGDPQAWPKNMQEREQLLQCTSYQMACFLAQNTFDGGNGVEWDVVLKDLIACKTNKHGMMVKSIAEWKRILRKLVKELGGWKK